MPLSYTTCMCCKCLLLIWLGVPKQFELEPAYLLAKRDGSSATKRHLIA